MKRARNCKGLKHQAATEAPSTRNILHIRLQLPTQAHDKGRREHKSQRQFKVRHKGIRSKTIGNASSQPQLCNTSTNREPNSQADKQRTFAKAKSPSHRQESEHQPNGK
eukprot:6357553-Amphidinium_carterae.1